MGHQYMEALRKTFKEFCAETSLTGFRYLVNPRNSYFEKCIWFLLQFFLFVLTIIMVLDIIEDIYEDPVVTTLDTVRYPIRNIAFPGISICNINKISKKRAIDYARLLSTRGNYPFDDMLNKIKILGKLHDYEIDQTSVNELLGLQIYLEKYGIIGTDNNSNDNDYLYYIMKNLATPCEELLHKCYLKGEIRNCAELFELRRTYEGFCCTFNYIVNTPVEKRFQVSMKPEHLKAAGKDLGLTVVVRNEPDDYFYPLISSIGTNVHIFNPKDYPDDISGGLIQILIGIGNENFLDLNAKTVYSMPEVQKYPLEIRRCIFPNEMATVFGTYSLSNCLVACRVQSILALCDCVPFNIPWYPNATQCLLTDIPCLDKYRGKWQTLFPIDLSDGLEQEKEYSLRCDHCYADCSGTRYTVSTNSAPLHLHQTGKKKHENISVIHVYYGHAFTKLYKQDVVNYWFEILSNIGGVMGIFLGVSCMSVIEFLYFITFRFILIFQRSKM